MHERVVAEDGEGDVAALRVGLGECETKCEIEQRSRAVGQAGIIESDIEVLQVLAAMTLRGERVNRMARRPTE